MALDLKYRPDTFEKVMGNQATVQALDAYVKGKDINHAFLFTGPSGTGKTTLARIAARELGCIGSDYTEMNSADFRGIDTVRDIRRQVQYGPMEGPARGWLLDECHMFSRDAQNAILKLLEEPPSHVFFFLATTEETKLLTTIRTRCIKFSTEELREEELVRLMTRVSRKERVKMPGEVLEQIARDSLGSARMALVILDQVIRLNPDQMGEVAQKAAFDQSQTLELCRALINRGSWKQIATLLRSLNEDPERIRRAVLGYCQSILLKGSENGQAYIVLDCFREPTYNIGMPGVVAACYESKFGDGS